MTLIKAILPLLRQVAAPLALLLTGTAHGDAGLMRAHLEQDAVSCTVFTAPTPPRVGPLDLSVLLLDGDELLVDATIDATLTPPSGTPLHVRLSTEAATTAFMQAAKFNVDQPGTWQVCVVVTTDTDTIDTSFELPVAAALPELTAMWPWLLPVPVVLGLVRLAHRRPSGR